MKTNFFTNEQKRNSHWVLIFLGVLLFCAFTVSCKSPEERELQKAIADSEWLIDGPIRKSWDACLLEEPNAVKSQYDLSGKNVRSLFTRAALESKFGSTKTLNSFTDGYRVGFSFAVVLDDTTYVARIDDYAFRVRSKRDKLTIFIHPDNDPMTEPILITEEGVDGHVDTGFIPAAFSSDGNEKHYFSDGGLYNESEDFFQRYLERVVNMILTYMDEAEDY